MVQQYQTFWLEIIRQLLTLPRTVDQLSNIEPPIKYTFVTKYADKKLKVSHTAAPGFYFRILKIFINDLDVAKIYQRR